MVRKVICALTSDWEKKTTAIEEANDLSTLTMENLIGNLMAYCDAPGKSYTSCSLVSDSQSG